jgi:tetratricopeptide (TPR) repeat protein
MLDCQIYDRNPGGHHLTSALLHAVAAIFLFLALQRMTARLWPSAWVAAVFAIHPLRVESVSWVAERKDVLSGLFCMMTLWLYARYAERPKSWGRYSLVVISFALGLTAKPMLVTLPFVLLLLDYWPLSRLQNGQASLRRFGQLIVEKTPLFVLAAASCVVTLIIQHDFMRPLDHLDLGWRVANATVAYVAYLEKMLYPTGLAVFYPLSNTAPPAPQVIAAVALLVTISVAVFAARKKSPYLLFGWLWYVGTLVPVIGLIQVGSQAMADRYTYLTQIGLYAAIAWGAAQVAASWPSYRRPVMSVAGLIVVGLTVVAWQQTKYWHDSATLWTHTLACTSDNPIAHNSLGNALTDRGETDQAIDHYRMAVEIDPGYAPAQHNLGRALAGRGQIDEAIVHYQQALAIKPNYAEAHSNLGFALASRDRVDEAIAHYRQALAIKPDLAEAHNNLGNALGGHGQIDEAIDHYQQALAIRPDFAEAHYNLGNALASHGQINEAIDHYRQALTIKPDYAEAYAGLGYALAGGGHIDRAVADYRKALSIKPDLAEAHYNLGFVLAGRGEMHEAIAHYRAALKAKPEFAEAHTSLGNALAGLGQIDEAVSHYRRAVEIEPGFAEAHANLGCALANLGKIDEAMAHYRKALEIKPDCAEAHFNLGHALAGHGEVDAAIAQYRAALKVKPDYAEAHNNLGNELAAREQFDEAIAHYQKALEIEPGNVRARFNLGSALARRGKSDEASAQYQKALALATAQNDVATADVIRARLKPDQPVAAGK